MMPPLPAMTGLSAEISRLDDCGLIAGEKVSFPSKLFPPIETGFELNRPVSFLICKKRDP